MIRRRTRALGWALSLVVAGCSPGPKAAPSAEPANEPSLQAVEAAVQALPESPPTEASAPVLLPATVSGTTPLVRPPRLGQNELRQRFLPFPRAVTDIVAMGEQTVAHQIPMTLAFFETRASAEEVLTFYAQHFAQRRWALAGTKQTSKVSDAPAISATDPEDHTQMTVMFLNGGKGETHTVILGLADVRPEARVPDDGDLPNYPGTRPIRVRSAEAGFLAYTVSLLTGDDLERVSQYYRERMNGLGYQEIENPPEEGEEQRRRLTFVQSTRVWQLHLSRHEEQTLVNAVGTTEHAEVTP